METTGELIWTFTRYMAGTLIAELLFFVKAVEKREHFWSRVLIGLLVCTVYSATYVPFQRLSMLAGGGTLNGVVSGLIFLWWFGASIVAIFCYKISIAGGMYRCVLGLAAQTITSTILQYIVCELLFPGIYNSNRLLYAVFVVLVYGGIYLFVYFVFAKRMQDPSKVWVPDNVMTFSKYFIILILLTVTSDICTYMYNRVGNPQYYHQSTVEYFSTIIVPWFCIGASLMVCVVFLISMYSSYEISSLQQEKRILAQLQKEKETQYEYSKENIDLINQKCHDIKRQISALKVASNEERDSLIDETRKAVQFYDAVVKTGNDTIDTILTEKSMYCINHDIILTCNINASKIGFMKVIDLYTLLGNALDNAIECVSRYNEKDKKVINVSVIEKGQMINILVSNYYDGHMELINGFPVTSKEDKDYHGYGIKSIQMIAASYHGDFQISVENRSFSIQVMIPIPD